MRTIIAGSRSISKLASIVKAVHDSGWTPTVVISGTASGADTLGEQWANLKGIPVERFPADWDKYGKSAGYRRNEQMADNAEALIAIWDGQSRGTKHMIDIAKRKGLKVFISVAREIPL